jgi:hypothetical protein
MYFQLKPAIRQLSLAFPLLLIALPAAIKAADERPGPALPPPSLYDTPGSSGQPLSTPSSITPAVQRPAVPAVTERAPAPQTAPPQPTPAPKAMRESAPEATPAATRATPPTPAASASTEPQQPGTNAGSHGCLPHRVPAAQKPWWLRRNAMSTLNSGERAQYAYDSPNHAIRTGYGGCVRTGWWTPGAVFVGLRARHAASAGEGRSRRSSRR